MAPGFPLCVNEKHILTIEAFYQALRYPNHPELQNEIINIKSPISAKRFGRRYIDHTRADWDKVRFKIMKFCINLKLYQHKERFAQVLLSTNGLPIVEFSHKDKVWGALQQGDYYIGINALGRLLMELRESVVNGTFQFTVPELDNLLFLGSKLNLESFKMKPIGYSTVIDDLL